MLFCEHLNACHPDRYFTICSSLGTYADIATTLILDYLGPIEWGLKYPSCRFLTSLIVLFQKNYEERKEKRRESKHPEPAHGPVDAGRRSYDYDRGRSRDYDRDDRRRDRRDYDRDYDRDKRLDGSSSQF
jgi:hypothetical protein